jgi:hypothetical protein
VAAPEARDAVSCAGFPPAIGAAFPNCICSKMRLPWQLPIVFRGRLRF